MNRCFFISKGWKSNVKTFVGILSLFSIVFLLPEQVAAQKTALVRTSVRHEVYGNVYQIRFSNRKNLSNHEFEKDFAIYDATGEVNLCLDRHKKTPEEVERWSIVAAELWTAARVLARTPRKTQIFDTTPLVESLNEAVKEFSLGNLVEKELVKQAVGQITSHTFLSKFDIAKSVGAPAIITVPIKVVTTLGEIEIKMRRLLYAFWMASGYADTAITLQTLANQRAQQLWTAIDAGEIVDISGGSLNIDVKSGTISGDISIDAPLRLRLAAEVYESNAKQAAQLGADLGDSPDAWGSFLLGLFGVGDLVGMVSEAFEAVGVKKDLDKLQIDTASKIARSIDDNIDDVYESSRDFYRGGFCWPEVIIYGDPLKYNRVYEGSSLTYTVVLRSDPGFKLTIPVSSDNADVTVSPDSLTFTPKNWYKPQAVTVRAAVDTDEEHDTVRLNHEIMGYGDQKRKVFFITVIETPNLSDLVVSSVSVDKTALASGESFRLDTTLGNQGGAISKPTILRFYRSSDANISLDDTELHTISINPINVGRQVTPWKRFTAPDVPGTYYYGVCVDSVQGEGNVGNNCSKAIQVTVEATSVPDLVVESISVSKTTLIPGESFRLDATLGNQGAAASKPTILRFYRSSDANISLDDTELHTISINPINVGRQFTPWKRFTGPDVPGTYYYGVCVDGVQGEGNVGNNCSKAIQITVETASVPDLVVESISVSQDTVPPGESFTLFATVTNNGGARSQSLTILRYYGPDHSEVGTSRVERLEPNQTSKEKRITLKALDEPGTYYYDVCVSRASGEVNTDNNCSTRVAITVGAPANQPPIASGTIPARTLAAGSSSVVVDVSGNFRDPDNDALTYTVRSDSIDVATVSVSDSQVTLTPQDAGIAIVTVTASDGSLTAMQRFSVTVTAVPVQNQAPVAIGTIPSRSMTVGIAGGVQVSGYFSDPNGDSLTYTARSDNTNIMTIFVSGDYLTLTPRRAGWTTVTVTANDGSLTATQRFTVTVTEAPTRNQAPVAVGAIPAQTLALGAVTPIRVAGYFRDSDGDSLTYTAHSDNTSVVTVSVSGPVVAFTPQRAGNATITVTASDAKLTATHRFRVTVVSSSFRVGDAIIVQNSSGGGLNGLLIRKEAGTGAEHIISVFDEATGIIREGPVPADGYMWWFVRWDPSDKVFCDVNPCDGWVFESFRGTRVIAKYTKPRVEISQNRVPVAVGTISDRTLTAGSSSVVVDVSDNFRDPDNDGLSYTVRSDNTGIASVSVSGSRITLTPQGAGIATITVTASDGELTASQRVRVTVQAAQSINQPPAAVGTISPQTLTVNGAAWRVNVFNYFQDADGDRLTYTARSADTNVATVGVSDSEVTITPQRAGSTMVHVTASDGSLEATQSISVTVASVPPVEDPTAFDLAIQSVTVSKDTLVPGESFTLSITIHNNGPGTSTAASLSYYYSFIQGRTPEDQIHREGTVKLASLASGANTTKSFRLNAPSTPKTYYYGAWLSGSTTDTNLYNDVATEVGVTVRAAQMPDLPDLVVESARVSKSALKPGERFTFYATVRNQGTDPAARTTLRYYRSADSTISKSDTEEDSDSIRKSLNPDQTSEEWDSLRAPNTPGTYYYGACVDGVPNEGNTNNNCSNAIAVTVYAPGPPDLIVENPRADKRTLEPGERFKFYATVRNQGTGDADSTTLYYNRSNDSNISENDPNERWDSVSSLDPNETGDEWTTLTAPNTPGTYYYGACVKSVSGENNTNNNCSTAIRITVQAPGQPDLVVDSARVTETTLEPGASFKFYATVRNQGTGDADSTTLRYYRSDDSNVSDRDTKEDTDRVTSLDPDETSDEFDTLSAPNAAGTYYYAAYVEPVSDESNTNNNWSQVFTITVENPGLQVGDSIIVQNSRGGGLNGLVVRSGPGVGFKHIISVFDGATGTITDGPEDNNGYTWWKVRWDRSDQVFCDVNPCVGWAIEFFQGTRVIAKDDALAAPLLNTVIPTETVLLSNYPNPFNPETWIPYQLSEASNVTVSIYSVDGKLVRTLTLGHQLAGIYQSRSRAAYWDGRNSFGERVASGLYFYTFTAGDFTATRKMLIRK